MFLNHLKIAFRNLFRNRMNSFINIAGLAVGMTVALLIGIWVWDEVSFNFVHTNHNRIAKLRQNINANGTIQTEKEIPFPLIKELRNNYSQYFEYIVPSSHRMEHLLSTGDRTISITGVYWGEEAPDMFSLKMLKGSRAGLKDPSSLFLSSSQARIFFGDSDPINRIIKIDNGQVVKVTGVYEDLPRNSTLRNVRFIAPFDLYAKTQWIKSQQGIWETNSIQGYVQLAKGVSMERVSRIIRDIKLNKVPAEERKYRPAIFLEPMNNWHLYEEFSNGVTVGGSVETVWMFGIIGFFVLLLACINFMNLSTARAQKRGKEVGIRKTIGSRRSQLIAQFFTESLLYVIIAFFIALVMAQLSLAMFNQIAAKEVSISWLNPWFWLLSLGFALLTAFLSGCYPAFYLSSFKPVKVLKGNVKVGAGAAIPRKILVVLQFTVSVVLIISTMVVYRQIQFARNRPIGYDPNRLITVQLRNSKLNDHYEVLRNEIHASGNFIDIARSESTTTDLWASENNLDWKGKDPNRTAVFPATGVSYNYGNTAGWKFLAGRDFLKDFASDSTALILNEAAVQYMGLQNPIGEIVKRNGVPFHVIGVIRNMIMESPYDRVKPSMFSNARLYGNYAIIRIHPASNAVTALAELQAIFNKIEPATPFDFRFVDEEYGRKFSEEERVGSLAGIFSLLAIFISCLGLFGMVSFTAEQRIKEIGVRKVLGASVFGLWHLLASDLLKLSILAFFIGSPVAWFFMNRWLGHYEYRSSIEFWVFAVAGLGTFLITLITVSYQSIKAAKANPVESLRIE